MRGRTHRRGFLALLLVIVGVVGVAGWTFSSTKTIQHLPYQHEFCFAEWCVAPMSFDRGPTTVTVGVHVRSDAKAVSQHPDHAQAWLVEPSGTQTGGPQQALERLVGPGEAYDTTLIFPVGSAGSCPRLLMSEGAWPSFLGLGYTPSPFAERVDWPLCG